MTDKYAVLGNPIAHSKSPEIHQQFARQTEQDMDYSKILVPLDGFEQAVVDFKASGVKGLNITVPFKLEAYQLADSLSKRARQAGAVNTLILEDDGRIVGDNTDGIGMVNDIMQNQQWPLKGKTILVLGAGGAVRGVLGPLLDQEPAAIVIANRTLLKAQQLAQAFSRLGNIQAVAYEDIPKQAFDVVINGTSASLSGDLPPIPVEAVSVNTACYDMMYAKEPTAFIAWAQQQGCTQTADGIGMLIEQAAEAFRLWRGIKPETQPLFSML